MKITILAFGIAKDIFNTSAHDAELDAGTTVAVFRKILESAYPDLKALKRYMVAVNEEYAEEGYIIQQDDEIAIIPPVSGG